MKNFKPILILLIACSLFIKCDCTSELDDEAPVITVLSPNEGAIFYTKASFSVSPRYLILEATATDEFKIVRATVTVYNSEGGIVGEPYEELSDTQSVPVQVYTSIEVDFEDDYRIVFEFEDINGNTSSVTRNVSSHEVLEVGSDGPI